MDPPLNGRINLHARIMFPHLLGPTGPALMLGMLAATTMLRLLILQVNSQA